MIHHPGLIRPILIYRQFLTTILLVLAGCDSGGNSLQEGLDQVAQATIVDENMRTDGVVPRSTWDALPDPQQSILGFASPFTALPGTTISFRVKATADSKMKIYRVGYYGGNGARQVTPTITMPMTAVAQGACSRYARPGGNVGNDKSTLPDCSNWQVSATWPIPSNAVSGLYLAKIYNVADPNHVSHIPFVVKEQNAGHADVLYIFSDATWQAYNQYDDMCHQVIEGDMGHPENREVPCVDGLIPNISLYSNNVSDVREVSYNRPFSNRSVLGTNWHFLFNQDIQLVGFLERNGISIGYAGSLDFEGAQGSQLLTQRKAALVSGHPEYVTAGLRDGLEHVADDGTNLLFFAGNFAAYKARYDATHNGLVVFKAGDAENDPEKMFEDWTGLWRDIRMHRPPAQPPRCSNSLTGVTHAAVAVGTSGDLTVPPAMTSLRFWRGTSCAASTTGCTLGVSNVGFESDLRADRYYEEFVNSQPPGLFSVSATILSKQAGTLSNGTKPFDDEADWFTPNFEDKGLLPAMTIECTLHRRASGALVFSSSSFNWAVSLDQARNDPGEVGVVSTDMQQATINLLADMNIQPGSLMSGLTHASPSTDVTPPVSAISQLNLASGIITGTASDLGGVVAGVEVSFDGGARWHGAALERTPGSVNWSYAAVEPATALPLVRAVDDSGNIEQSHGAGAPFPVSDGVNVATFGVDPLGADGKYQQIAAPPPFGVISLDQQSIPRTPGWTSIIPMTLNLDSLTDLLSYNANTGIAQYSVASGPGSGLQLVTKVVQAAPGWTTLVPMNINNDIFTDSLSYNARTGLMVFAHGGSGGTGGESVVMLKNEGDCRDTCAHGWTSIVPMNINNDTLTDLLFYNAATGLALYTVQKPTPGAADPFVMQVVAVVSDRPGWTSIVPMQADANPFTDLLFYNAGNGHVRYSTAAPAVIGSHCEDTDSCPHQMVSSDMTISPGWTSITPMNLNGDSLTDLVFYNAAMGRADYSVGIGPGGQEAAGPPTFGFTQWTSIVPMTLSFSADSSRDLMWNR